jgi:hypothetical protein
MSAKEKRQTQKVIRNSVPDALPLTKRQARRLALLSGVDVGKLQGATVAQLKNKFQWQIDPDLLLFRRICGQVVKTDPASGIEYPVPFATVHVEDTDCGFLGFFPYGSPWHWLFPLFCHREEIGVTQTDACGRFCVWVPRFDIDWIIRWRLEKHCYWEIFRPPILADLLDLIRLDPPVAGPVVPHRPWPDPGPWREELSGEVIRQLEAVIGRDRANRLTAVQKGRKFGQLSTEMEKMLNQPAFTSPMPPPDTHNLMVRIDKEGRKGVAASLGIVGERAKRIESLNPRHYIGPFIRCHYHIMPELMPIFDVPDITFRVTQDVNCDGIEETIYGEGFFDIRWNSGAIPDVKLHASTIAVASPIPADSPACSDGAGVPCETPAIVLAGLYPLQNLPASPNPYHDSNSGYAQRPNRPHPNGTPSQVSPAGTLATAPFSGVLQLYGCNSYAGAKYYRVLYSYVAPGKSPTSVVPFQGLAWPLWRWVGSPGHLEILNVAPDAAGWYTILNDSDGWMPAHLLLNWPSGDPGLYRVQLEFADNGKHVIAGSQTTPLGIYVDNSRPAAVISEIRWRVQGEAVWREPALSRMCGVIMRPVGAGLEFKVTYQAAAMHLRDLLLTGSGCGAANPERLNFTGWSEPPSAEFDVAGVSLNPYEHWHAGPNDNNISRSAIFSLSPVALQGAYDFSLWVNSRAFNPAGGDGGYGALDWYYDNPYPIYGYDYWKFAIIDA